MDFIERLFHLSPDGGSGTTETLFLLVPFLVVCIALLIRRSRARRP